MHIFKFAIATALTFAAVPAIAQNYPNQSSDQMRRDQRTPRDDQARRDDAMRQGDQSRRDDRGNGDQRYSDGAHAARRYDHRGYSDRGHGYGEQRHCRTVWYHHRRVRQCG